MPIHCSKARLRRAYEDLKHEMRHLLMHCYTQPTKRLTLSESAILRAPILIIKLALQSKISLNRKPNKRNITPANAGAC